MKRKDKPPYKPHKCPLCLMQLPPVIVEFKADSERTKHNAAKHPEENGMRPRGRRW